MAMHAVILAAGKGERLSPVWNDRPKGCLELGGLTLVERSIRQLRTAGVHRVVLVTGYAAHHYAPLAQQYPGVELVHNTHYADSGSLFSLYCAREGADPPFLLLESDLVYESRALAEVIACPFPNAILMSGFTQSADEVFISTRGERVVRLSKNPGELHNITGELVGITKICAPMFDAMMAYAEQRFAQDKRLHYEDGINGITADVPVFYHKVDDLVWAEIDTPAHLKRVTERILPRLAGEWEEERRVMSNEG